MSEASTRTQFLDFKLLRECKFTAVELAVLTQINTYSSFSCDKLEVIGARIQKSARTVQRAIQSLKQKGMISVRYGFLKRLIITIVPLAEQLKLRGMGIVKNVIRKVLKKQKKAPDTTKVSRPKTTSMSHQRNETEKNKTLNIEKNFSFNSVKKPIWELVEEQKRMAREFLGVNC